MFIWPTRSIEHAAFKGAMNFINIITALHSMMFCSYTFHFLDKWTKFHNGECQNNQNEANGNLRNEQIVRIVQCFKRFEKEDGANAKDGEQDQNKANGNTQWQAWWIRAGKGSGKEKDKVRG